ncbi:uncharacterized protein LOC111398064 [Olea europaea var. sylvestris]|uniref:uncharacterized protein LOC111398064 n=1 Tax=Olea europaea var. sylvestris TaxID=158386 RepID=UPI000C1D4F97|nr:uncharacterized protein LOC111398064 [Olea europaea var. sylvestris]
MLTIVYVDDNFKWMLRGSSVKQSAIFMIRKFNNVHTCSIYYCRNAHRHATSSVIAEQIMGKLDNTYGSYDPTVIARNMEREFDVKISYHQARRGKVASLHMLHGTRGDSFQKLSSYCHVLRESNPGTVTHIKLDSRNRFYYFFQAFGASIQGYVHYLRPVICVDDSHLKGDSNELVFVSVRKNSIENAIAHLFPRAHHECCVWHMKKNLIQRYNNASSIFLFKRAAKTYRTEEFERLMGQLRRLSTRAYGYLEQTSFPFWSRALFVGQRCNILTNNNAESLNSMLRHARSLRITCSVEHIRYTMQKWFYECPASAITCSTVLSPTMKNELQTTFKAGSRLRAHGLTDNLTQVGISNDTDIVDFSENTCTCHEFQLNRMSCIHVTRAACLRGKSLYDLCSLYYIFEYWKGAYRETIYLVLRELDLIVLAKITCTPIMPLSVRRPPGTPPTRRKRSKDECTTLLRKCTRCGGLDHNRTTCSNHTVPRPM